jgi:hypothetical protein
MPKPLGSSDVTDFAIELAQDFAKRCPPDAGAKSAIGLARAIDDICNRAAAFQRQTGLGVYRRAKFGTEFKYRLKESGHAPEFVDELTTKLLISMSGK